MKRRLLVPLLAALVVAMVVGPAGVKAVEPRAVTARMMIPAAAFSLVPHQGEYVDFAQRGDYLEGDDWWPQSFVAPVEFPVEQVTVRGITLYAYDYDGTSGRVCASLFRATPAQGIQATKLQGKVCTIESSIYPQVVPNLTRMNYTAVDTATNGSYLYVDFDPRAAVSSLQVFGVRITYSYEPAA